MSECKRCALTIVPMEEASSSEPTISKKRKTAATANSASFQLRSSHAHHRFPDTTVSPEASVNSAGTVVSGEPCSDRSCCSSSHVKELHTAPLDLQVLVLQILTYYELCTFIVFDLRPNILGCQTVLVVFSFLLELILYLFNYFYFYLLIFSG